MGDLYALAPTVVLAAILVSTPFWCWRIGFGWPSTLRDWAVRSLLWGAVALGLLLSWPLAVMLGVAIWQWKSPDTTHGIWVWGGALGLWAFVTYAPLDGRWLFRAIVAGAMIEVGVLLWQGGMMATRWRDQVQNYHMVREAFRGSMGNRVMTGAYFAFAAPLAESWWTLIPILGGLVLSSSGTALAAGMIGLSIAYPGAQAWLLGLGVILFLTQAMIRKSWRDLLRRPSRFVTIYADSMRDRLWVWTLTVGTWWRWGIYDKRFWLGAGHHAFFARAHWWICIRATQQIFKQAHNDVVQLTMEYGAVGVLCALSLMCTILWKGSWDPTMGALLSLLVVSLNQFPFHTAHLAIPWLVLAAYSLR